MKLWNVDGMLVDVVDGVRVRVARWSSVRLKQFAAKVTQVDCSPTNTHNRLVNFGTELLPPTVRQGGAQCRGTRPVCARSLLGSSMERDNHHRHPRRQAV